VLHQAGVAPRRVQFFRFPTDRGWTRDFGPMFVKSGREVAIARFRFTGWGKYPDHRKDDEVPVRAARALGLRLLSAKLGSRDIVLEGGSIDVNGRGTLITTEECLLSRVQARNLGLSRKHLESVLTATLGVTNVWWLGRGIAGDDTHGHVDDVCRFVSPSTLVLVEERNPRDANYRALAENRERLGALRLEDGSKPEVVRLPMPAPLVFRRQRLPASYANFYIGNAAVLVPTFNDPADRVALGTLSELITDRPVVGIHAVDLVWGLGTIHCLTQQQPA
jgi:agmatine deiminase